MAPYVVVVTVGDQRQHDVAARCHDLLDVLLVLARPRVDDHTVRVAGGRAESTCWCRRAP